LKEKSELEKSELEKSELEKSELEKSELPGQRVCQLSQPGLMIKLQGFIPLGY
jgi:hypothetical protein